MVQPITDEFLGKLYGEWLRAVEYGYATKARELREMYLALRDRQFAQAQEAARGDVKGSDRQ